MAGKHQKEVDTMKLALWAADNWAIILGAALVLVALQVAFFLRKKSKKPFLDPSNFQPLTLVEKTFISHNTVRLRFSLADPYQRLGLPIGQHITFLAKDDEGKDVYRPYTPVSDDDQLGCVDFVIKIYPLGKMSKVLNSLPVGGSMLMKGPRGRFQYKPNMVKHIGMIGGGTGITPLYQVLNAVLKNPKDKTKVSLVYGNLTKDDILLKKELDQLVAMHADRFTVYYVLNQPPPAWDGGSGFVSKEMIVAHCKPPGGSCMMLSCGPPPMCNAVKQFLDAIGYSEESQFQF